MLCPLRLEVDALEASSPSIIDLAMVRTHTRVDSGDDELLDLYVQAAVRWAEGATHRTIVQRGHVWILRDFPDCYPYGILLPRGVTVSVTQVDYSSGGSVASLTGPSSSPAGDDYQEDLRGADGGVIMPSRGGSWPSVDSDVPAPVAISFVAGWPADDIPADLLHAIMFAVSDCYELRGTPDFDPAMLGSSGTTFAARQALVSGYALPRIY